MVVSWGSGEFLVKELAMPVDGFGNTAQRARSPCQGAQAGLRPRSGVAECCQAQ